MQGFDQPDDSRWSHELLLHDSDAELVAAARSFVDRGLAAGAEVLVHGDDTQVALLRGVLAPHPRLAWGLDAELYLSPSRTLHMYDDRLAGLPAGTPFWVLGSVPFGDDPALHPAWSRYESLVNEVLRPYDLHALCTYDTRRMPAEVVAAARVTHPVVVDGTGRHTSPGYVGPRELLARTGVGPWVPDGPPAFRMTLRDPRELAHARDTLGSAGGTLSAVPWQTVRGFVGAVHEVLTNGLQHGGAPVRLSAWLEVDRLTALVTDAGTAPADPLAGYRRPAEGLAGLWAARWLCEEVVVDDDPDGGWRVLVSTGA